MKTFVIVLFVSILFLSSSTSSNQRNIAPGKRAFSSINTDWNELSASIKELRAEIQSLEEKCRTIPEGDARLQDAGNLLSTLRKSELNLCERRRLREEVLMKKENKKKILLLREEELMEKKNNLRVKALKSAKLAERFDRSSVKWLIEDDMLPKIEDSRMSFVNRDSAVTQLEEIHRSNLIRALEGSGEEWTIPLCDNIFGLGKTELAKQYVKQCNIKMSGETFSSKSQQRFKESMQQAHSALVCFRAGELANPKTFEMVIIERLQKTLIPQFEVAPHCLYDEFSESCEFLSELIDDAGPMFIALDEIGSAFCVLDLNDVQRRDLFFKFCVKVLSSWLLIPKLYFLLLGRGSFLNFVGSRVGTNRELTSSPFKFERLSLNFLRPPYIKAILSNTYLGEQTLFSFYQLDDGQADQVARHLYWQTTGHPRSLLRAFKLCKTSKELLDYSGSGTVIENYAEFYKFISLYRREIEDLLSKYAANAPVNLRQEVRYRHKSIPLEIVVNNAFITWEGKLEAAYMQVSPASIHFIATYLSGLREYLALILKSLDLSLDFADIFEVMLMKRFQEIFKEAHCPAEALPEFFSTAIFGSCQDFCVSGTVTPMPRISSIRAKGKRLTDTNVAKVNWPALLKDMDQYDSLCLKPALRSSSSDILLCGKTHRNQQLHRYTIGIAAKNFNVAYANMGDIRKECNKFNTMFNQADPSVSRIKILIICATQYGSGLKSQFEGKKFFTLDDLSAWTHIDEVVVMDLSSPQNRADFFGIGLDDDLIPAIESVISKCNKI